MRVSGQENLEVKNIARGKGIYLYLPRSYSSRENIIKSYLAGEKKNTKKTLTSGDKMLHTFTLNKEIQLQNGRPILSPGLIH